MKESRARARASVRSSPPSAAAAAESPRGLAVSPAGPLHRIVRFPDGVGLGCAPTNGLDLGALGTGLHVDRHAFNEALVRVAAAEGAHVLAPGRLMTAAREGTAWRLIIRHEARAATLTAAALVDCSGRRAVVARRAGATRHVDDPLVAVVAWLDAFNDSDLDATLIVEAARDGWWYSAGCRTAVESWGS